MMSTELAEPTAPAATVCVAVVDLPRLRLDVLVAALDRLTGDSATAWRVRRDTETTAGEGVDIVLCDGTDAVRSTSERWPDANVLALVSAHGGEAAVVAALEAGAHVCVRDADPAVVAAYLHSIARRRRLATGRGR